MRLGGKEKILQSVGSDLRPSTESVWSKCRCWIWMGSGLGSSTGEWRATRETVGFSVGLLRGDLEVSVY